MADNFDASAAGSDEAAPEAADYTPRELKDVTQELLKFGLVESERKPNLYRIASTRHHEINAILEPLDLRLKIDDVRGLAFLIVNQETVVEVDDVSDMDEWSHPLVRRQRLTLEQSLLVAVLRQQYLAHEQESGIGAGGVTISIDEVLSSTSLYIKPSGSEASDQKRIRNLLENLRGHGIVSEVDDKGQVTVRPIITHLANPESLVALLAHFKSIAVVGQSRTDGSSDE